jgi:hypothetical protein
MEAGRYEEAVPMEAFSVIALAVIVLLLLALILLGVLTILTWSRTRSLAWRVQDLEDAVRRLQAERRAPRDLSGGSTAIRE